MALDSRFVLAYWASDYFVNKDTGKPLANGTVTFYKDNDRTKLKNIYTLSGVPPYSSASYVALPNPLTLSISGNPLDFDGNNVDIYFFPYEGNPDDENDTVELYYVVVKDENGIVQYDRSALPNIVQQDIVPEAGELTFNYVPNGQFLTHYEGQANGSKADGTIQQLITPIAPGGWTFERSSNLATDIVTFYRFGAPLSGNPSGNPRYGFQLNCTSPSGTDSFKHLRLKFPNCNRFASTTEQLTVSFTAQSLSADFDVSLYMIRNFGTGGSAPPPWQLIGTFTISSMFSIKTAHFLPGINTGATIGPNDDDYIQFAVAYPTNVVTNSIFTDFLITDGVVDITAYPEQTNAEYLSGTLPGYEVPDYDGFGIGLPIRQTRNGYESDASVVGKLSPVGYDISKIDWAEKLCDGSGLIYGNYTTDGIPLSRLGDKLWDATTGYFLFGSDLNFVTSNLGDTATNFSISTNIPGAKTVAANGTTAFTFTNIGVGATTYGVTGYHYWQSAPTVATIISNSTGYVANDAADFDTGCTIVQVRNENFSYNIFTVNTTGHTITGGQYFTFSIINPATDFYVWFKVNGVGADPAPGGTGILINLPAAPTAAEIAAAIVAVLSGYTYSYAAVSAVPTAGQYFTFTSGASNQQYAVYYIVNNVGTAPVIAGAITIPVSLPASPTAAQVAAATKLAINKYAYALPDMRGLVPRGLDSTGIWDIDYLTRLSKLPRGTGNLIGSIELDSILRHDHGGQQRNDGGGANLVIGAGTPTNPRYTRKMTTNLNQTTDNDQGETRGVNIAFHWTIHL